MFDEIHLIREWIGAIPLDTPFFPLWGITLRHLAALGGDILTYASVLSLLMFLCNAAIIFFAVRGLFSLSVRIAERLAVVEEMKYDGLEYLAAAIVTALYLMTPGFFRAAFEPSPLIFAHFFVSIMFFGLARLVNAKYFSTFISWTILIGVAAAFSLLNGAIGWLPIPLVIGILLTPYARKGVLVMPTLGLFLGGFVFTFLALTYFCFTHPVSDVLRVIALTILSFPDGFIYPGSLVFLFMGVLPLFVGAVFVSTGKIRPKVLRLTFFLGWAGVAGAVAVVTLVLTILGLKNPNEQFVDGILESLNGRDVVISDGTFDDMLVFRLPPNVILVTLGNDKKVPQALLDSIGNADVKFAADFGTTAFVEEWLKHDISAFGRVVVAADKNLATIDGGDLVPEGWCWRGELVSHRLDGEALSTRWYKRWTEIGEKIQDRNQQCWYMRRIFALQGMRIAEILRSEGREMSAENLIAFVVGHIDASFSREAEKRRTIDRERIVECVRKLGELDALSAVDRSARLVELEDSILPELERTVGGEANWLIHVYRGEIALKKGTEFHREARDEYRAATIDERSDLNATAGKLLLLDAALKDESGTESDALTILRRDRANRMALAIWGNALAVRGENEKAAEYLKRATTGDGPVMLEPLNDYAEVLSRLGRLEEALEISDRVLEHAKTPNWTFLETRAALLMRLGQIEEAKTMLERAVEEAKVAKQEDCARNILDIDRARLMKLTGTTGAEYRNFVRNIRSRTLTPAHRKLVDEL